MSSTTKENKTVTDSLRMLNQGNITGARRQLEIATRAPNATRAAWQALATACSRGGDFAAARIAIERAIQMGAADANLFLMASNIAQDRSEERRVGKECVP